MVTDFIKDNQRALESLTRNFSFMTAVKLLERNFFYEISSVIIFYGARKSDTTRQTTHFGGFYRLWFFSKTYFPSQKGLFINSNPRDINKAVCRFLGIIFELLLNSIAWIIDGKPSRNYSCLSIQVNQKGARLMLKQSFSKNRTVINVLSLVADSSGCLSGKNDNKNLMMCYTFPSELISFMWEIVVWSVMSFTVIASLCHKIKILK